MLIPWRVHLLNFRRAFSKVPFVGHKKSVLAGEWASSELARPLSGFKGLSRQSQLFKN